MGLRRTAALTGALALLGGPAAGAAVSPTPSATAILSTDRAGARPVALVVRLHYEMQCGWPGEGRLTIRFPAAMRVPRAVPRAAVRVDGKPTRRLGKRGRLIAVALPLRPQILCDAIGPGTLTVAFTRAAGLGNPPAPGRYPLRATRGSLTFLATLTVRRR
ncbi:MAG: hypothetical protein ACRDM1_16545 [Gaiellaceae bacterium]